MRKFLLRGLITIIILYGLACLMLFLFQEKIIFHPEKLNNEYAFSFDQPFEELNFKARDGKQLNGILFLSDSSKGLIFYLHGNSGSLKGWGHVAKTYTTLGYNVFMMDYRGYGKSEGFIQNENQLYDDIQLIYDQVKKRVPENHIILLGYSIGTGPAAKLASDNHPRLLILQAPYYSLTDLMSDKFPMVPSFLLKYKFETISYLKKCPMRVVIFHGNQDQVIYTGSSVKLKEAFKASDTLIILHGQGHNGITENPDYLKGLQDVVEN